MADLPHIFTTEDIERMFEEAEREVPLSGEQPKKTEAASGKITTIEVSQTVHVRDAITTEDIERIFEEMERENPFPSSTSQNPSAPQKEGLKPSKDGK